MCGGMVSVPSYGESRRCMECSHLSAPTLATPSSAAPMSQGLSTPRTILKCGGGREQLHFVHNTYFF